MTARTGLFVAPLPGAGGAAPAGTSPTDGRLALGGLLGTAGGCVTGNVWTSSATAMQFTLGASVWRIPDPTNALAVFLSPADPYTFTLAAGPATGSRIDVLWVKQDNYENGDTDSRVTYGVAQGVASANPGAPAIPAGCMALAQVSVPTNASNAAACSLALSFNQSSGFVPQLQWNPSPATFPPAQYVGQKIILPSQGTEYRWNGSSWVNGVNSAALEYTVLMGAGRDGRTFAGPVNSAGQVNGDWDQLTQPGVYQIVGSATNTNSPIAEFGMYNYGVLLVIAGGSGSGGPNGLSVTQIFVADGTNGMAWRTGWNGLSGSSWVLAGTVGSLSASGLFGMQPAFANGMEYRWSAALSQWRPWHSDWMSYTPGTQGISGSNNASPGWLVQGRYRYTGGKVRAEWALLFNGGGASSTGRIVVNLPVTADGGSGPASLAWQTGGTNILGAAWGRQNANGRTYSLLQSIDTANLYLAVINSAFYLDGVGQNDPWQFAQSDQLFGVLEYDPA